MQTRDNKAFISDFSKNLNLSYDWFEKNFGCAVLSSFADFWEKDNIVKLVSVSENECSLAQNEEFFVTQIRLNKELSVFIKLSKSLVKNLLQNILGSNGKDFNIQKITELEAKILTSFNDFLSKRISHLIKDIKDIPANNTNYNECNLFFIVQNKNDISGKFLIKIPTVALDPERVLLSEDVFSIRNFPSAEVCVRLKVGQSRIKLSDLKNLEKDDIVLLEQSCSSEMTLVLDNLEHKIKVAQNSAIILDEEFEEDGANSKGEEYMGNDIYNMWDSIQVEIGAEFEKVKLSLGELKQISEGLVIDIASLYDNKIDLKVENKIVASGELVIINDRYGVRINQVVNEEPEMETTVPEDLRTESVEDYDDAEDDDLEENLEENSNFENSQEINEEDAFDYSDFDVDDEDI